VTVSLEQVTIAVAELTDDVDLVVLLRQQNDRLADQRHCWTLLGAQVSLVVGVAGDLGVLAWYGRDAADGMEVSSGGSNIEPVDYLLGGLYQQPFPPGCEISVDQVLTAVREFVATGSKPQGVCWQPERTAWRRATD
jgi:hypothetical protein